MLISAHTLQASALIAADNGATIAIALALITLIGTLCAQAVTFHKLRTEAQLTNEQLAQEKRRSDVEIAQNVMSQTVVVLNDRLKSESAAYELRITTLSNQHTREIEVIKAEHKRDVARLERKIDKVTADWDACKVRNQELTDELAALKERRGSGGT